VQETSNAVLLLVVEMEKKTTLTWWWCEDKLPPLMLIIRIKPSINQIHPRPRRMSRWNVVQPANQLNQWCWVPLAVKIVFFQVEMCHRILTKLLRNLLSLHGYNITRLSKTLLQVTTKAISSSPKHLLMPYPRFFNTSKKQLLRDLRRKNYLPLVSQNGSTRKVYPPVSFWREAVSNSTRRETAIFLELAISVWTVFKARAN
jgi:hypothetical protein